MMTFNFNKWNTILGWFAFAIALITYSLTVEPTMSFWDCGEYIATAAKLEVGHPPGAPLFQMIGAFFCHVCYRSKPYCLNGKYDVCFFECFYNTFYVLVVLNLIKKVNFTVF